MDTELFTILNFVLENNSYIRSVMRRFKRSEDETKQNVSVYTPIAHVH